MKQGVEERGGGGARQMDGGREQREEVRTFFRSRPTIKSG